MKIAFMSDLHLNFVAKSTIEVLGRELLATNADCAIIAGDIAESKSIHTCLRVLADVYKKPIYYVNGNHDAYGSSFVDVIAEAKRQTNLPNQLCKWLPEVGIVELTKNTCLVGVDNFYDGRYGDFWGSNFQLSDFGLIEEIRLCKTKQDKISLFNMLGDVAAFETIDLVSLAASKYKNIIIVCHVPPFKEASLYLGNPASEQSLPFFACKAMGDAIMELSKKYSKHNIGVLTGHTHDQAYYEYKNIKCFTAKAKYYYPEVFATMELK